MIEKLKEVLKEYQDEPCVSDGIKCKDCKFNIEVAEVFDDEGEEMRLCEVLDGLSNVLEVV